MSFQRKRKNTDIPDRPKRQTEGAHRDGSSTAIREEIDLINDDEDDIPYTHSRSVSPNLSSELDDLVQRVLEETQNDANNNNNPEVINLSEEDEDAVREYYVLTDDDENEHEGTEKGNSDDALTFTQKSTSDQLRETIANTDSFDKVKCAICFETPEKTLFLPCGHIYCHDCIFKALSSTKYSTQYGGPCSLCRNYTPYKKVVPLILKKKKKTLRTV